MKPPTDRERRVAVWLAHLYRTELLAIEFPQWPPGQPYPQPDWDDWERVQQLDEAAVRIVVEGIDEDDHAAKDRVWKAGMAAWEATP